MHVKTKACKKSSTELGQTKCKKSIKQLLKKLYKKGCEGLGNKECIKLAINYVAEHVI